MYYRIQDETTKEYLPSVYNQESKTLIKTEIEILLGVDLSSEDIHDVIKLKWDQFSIKIKEFGYILEEQVTPFSPEECSSEIIWDTDLYEGSYFN